LLSRSERRPMFSVHPALRIKFPLAYNYLSNLRHTKTPVGEDPSFYVSGRTACQTSRSSPSRWSRVWPSCHKRRQCRDGTRLAFCRSPEMEFRSRESDYGRKSSLYLVKLATHRLRTGGSSSSLNQITAIAFFERAPLQSVQLHVDVNAYLTCPHKHR